MNYIVYNKLNHENKLSQLNIFIGENVKIGNNVKLFAGVKLLGDCVVGDECEIGDNSVIKNSQLKQNVKVVSSFVENCIVGEMTTIGPFATLKKGSVIGENCRIGNFVEIKNSKIGKGTKIAHLAYVGDAEIGEDCNVGCGVVFCNYDGAVKRKSIVGSKVFIGSNVNIVAPVKIGDEAYIAAGSTINKDIPNHQFAIARSLQINKENFKNPFINK